jgi:tetratricopeptide (TPR) repeat protein
MKNHSNKLWFFIFMDWRSLIRTGTERNTIARVFNAMEQRNTFIRNYCIGKITPMKNLIVLCFLISFYQVSAQNVIEYYNKANVQSQYQNYDEAIRLLTRALAIKPDYADAYALRGDCNYYLKAYDKAIADYLQDDKLKKNRSSYSLACTYSLAGKNDDAFRALEANLSSEYKIRMSHLIQDADLEPLHNDLRWTPLTKKEWYSSYELAINEADTKIAANEIEGAIESLTLAIKIAPANAKAYGSRALMFLRTGDMQKCLDDLNAAIQADPGKSVLFGNRAYTNNKLGNKEQALADYEKAIQLDPANLVYYDLAIARYMAGNKAGGLEAIVKHMDYFTKDEMGYYFGGIIASETDHFNESVDYFNKAIALNNTVPQFYMKRGDAQFLLKKYDDAVTDYSTVIQLDPANAEAYYIRGNAKGSLLDREGACLDWKKAGELGFEDTNGYIRDLCK